ncbi:MAG TPA: sn-glycerol-3-phosphate ABC transporter ATP-binding protein UgpC [bacterium]|nr:sn-glycerol-3-phosphate ABC transporter ATP-binding protein UgpC [bacterium]
MSRVGFKDLTKLYDKGVVAVDHVTFEVADKEFFVLVGPSGCGKSTTLRLVAGLEEPTSGEIYIGDRMVNDVEPRDRDIAMVFQNYALYPHMSVQENMAFALKLRKVPKEEIRTRVDEAARILGITDLLSRKPAALSGGQRQRVALGRAIVRHPKVFLFDEPLSNLDAKLRVGMRTELARIHRQLETTVFYVTHDQVEAMTLGQRIGVMKDGRLLQVADSMTLYNRPVNKFVAGFIGSPPMNFLFGRIDDQTPLSFSHNSFRLELGPTLTDRLAPARGKPVVLGVRPEGLVLGEVGTAQGHDRNPVEDSGSCPKPVLNAVVDVVEQMGNEVIVYLKAGENSLIARVPPQDAPRPGDSVTVGFTPDHLHLFDAQTELTIV